MDGRSEIHEFLTSKRAPDQDASRIVREPTE
jgi:hypothetical protein